MSNSTQCDPAGEASVAPYLMDTKRAMAYCGIKISRTWTKFRLRHKIPYIRTGNSKYYNRDALDRILIKATTGPSKLYPR